MKKLLFIFIATILCLTGCGKISRQDEAPLEPTTYEYFSEASESYTASDISITSASLSSEITADDGTIILTINASYPVIENSEIDIFNSLNNELKQNAKDFISKTENGKLKDSALKAYKYAKENKYDFTSYQANQSFEITYNENNLLSLVTSYTENTGSETPNYSKTSATYDMTSGKALKATDILNATEDDIFTILSYNFTKLVNETPDAYYENALKILPQSLDKYGFYLTEDGVIFYLQPYIISPYETGFPEFILSYEDNLSLF